MPRTHWLIIVALSVALAGCAAPAPWESPVPSATAPVQTQTAAPGETPAPVEPSAPQPTGPWVTVRALPDDKPVVDALVWVAGVENMGRTNAQGRAQLWEPLPPGEQMLVVTPLDHTVYRESRYLITITAGAPEEYSLAVSPDRPLTFDHGQEVPTPHFSPAPQVVSAELIAPSEGFWQVHAMRGARSAWVDGKGQEEGFWEPFFVFTGSNPDQPTIGTYLLNGGGRWNVVYDCPRPIGVLTITGIDETGMLISFSSTSGVTGSFHLLTHEWQFEQTK